MRAVVTVVWKAHDVYVGRPSPEFNYAVWGNPFIVGRDGDAASCVAKHKRWLWDRIQSGEQSEFELALLHGQRLACYCKRKGDEPCHGDNLADAAAWAFGRLSPARQRRVRELQGEQDVGDHVPALSPRMSGNAASTSERSPAGNGTQLRTVGMPSTVASQLPDHSVTDALAECLEGAPLPEGYGDLVKLRDDATEAWLCVLDECRGTAEATSFDATADSFGEAWTETPLSTDVEFTDRSWRTIRAVFGGDAKEWIADQDTAVLAEEWTPGMSVQLMPRRNGAPSRYLDQLKSLVDQCHDALAAYSFGSGFLPDEDYVAEARRGRTPTFEPRDLEDLPPSAGTIREVYEPPAEWEWVVDDDVPEDSRRPVVTKTAPWERSFVPDGPEREAEDVCRRPGPPQRRTGRRLVRPHVAAPNGLVTMAERKHGLRRAHSGLAHIAALTMQPDTPESVLRYVDRIWAWIDSHDEALQDQLAHKGTRV